MSGSVRPWRQRCFGLGAATLLLLSGAGCSKLIGIGEVPPEDIEDTGRGDTGTMEPDTQAADTASMDTGAADTGAVDSTLADTGSADTRDADTAVAETSVADTGAADGSAADTNAIDTSVADAADTSVADTSAADSAIPDSPTTDSGADSGDASTCGNTALYPASQGCAFAPGFGNAHTWACWKPPATLGPGSYTILTLCGDDVAIDARTKLMWSRREEAPANWTGAKAACTASRKGGFSDWRLPSRQELVSLVDYSAGTQYVIDTTTFRGQAGGSPTNELVWTSSHPANTAYPFSVDFRSGITDRTDANAVAGVRCVR